MKFKYEGFPIQFDKNSGKRKPFGVFDDLFLTDTLIATEMIIRCFDISKSTFYARQPLLVPPHEGLLAQRQCGQYTMYQMDTVYNVFGLCRYMMFGRQRYQYFSRKRLLKITGYSQVQMTRALKNVPSFDGYEPRNTISWTKYGLSQQPFENLKRHVLYRIEDVLHLVEPDKMYVNELVECFELLCDAGMLTQEQQDWVLNQSRVFYHPHSAGVFSGL